MQGIAAEVQKRLAARQQSGRPCTAASSLAFEVSIPAVIVLTCVIFVDPTLSKRTKRSSNHTGPMKELARSCYQISHTLD